MRIDINKLKIAGIVIILIISLVLSIAVARWAMSLRDPENFANFQSWISALGAGGWIVLFVLQYLHIVIAIIPGGPIQLVIGALLGPWGGLAVCLGGTALATATVFWLVSRFGRSAVSLLVGERDINKYKFLNNEGKLELLVLILFFIPGLPKDSLTYLFAITKIKMPRFLMLSTFARLPALATSLVAGDSIASGHWGRAAVMFVILTAVSLTGFLLQKKILDKHEAKK